MPLKISYWSGGLNKNTYGREISAESLTITATSGLAGLTPTNAEIVRIEATEAAHYSYTSATSTAVTASTPYLAANAIIDIEAVPGWKVAGKTP